MEWMTATEAARTLGVKVATVYSYAAKGLLVAHQGDGRGRRSRYSRAEVNRLKQRALARAGHTAVAAGALRWGEPVLDSAITRIDPQRGPVYRGLAAVDLAQSERFEAVAELLWQGTLQRGARWAAGPLPRLPRAGPPLLRATRVLAELGLASGAGFVLAGQRELERARATIRVLAASFAPDGATARDALTRPDVASSLFVALTGSPPSERQRRAVDQMLVLSADHELNASTFAARVAAGAGASLFACLTAAMATVSGPRHGGSAARIEALVTDAVEQGVQRLIPERLAQGDGFAGFEIAAYAEGDPRTPPLLATAWELGARVPRVRVMRALVGALREVTGEQPGVDFGMVAVATALGLPALSGSVLFAVGRVAGWVAHVLEQRESNASIRPRARYVGR